MRSLRRAVAPLLASLALPLVGCARVDFGVANYASKNVYSKDLDNVGTKWWLGGEGVYDPAQQAMTRHGYNHIPTVPVGRDLLRQGAAPYVYSSDPQNDSTTCQTMSCPLPTALFAQEAQAVVSQTVLGLSGYQPGLFAQHDLTVRGREAPLVVHTIDKIAKLHESPHVIATPAKVSYRVRRMGTTH